MSKKNFRVAIVHDYLVTFGGGERVLIALYEIWPKADVFVAVVDKKGVGKFWSYFKNWNIKTSWFQKVPWSSRLISPLRFLLPIIWKSFDLSNYDLVISSSSWGMAKSVSVKPGAKHFCYCHTPPRFLYGYPQARKWTKYWPIRIYSAIVNHFLRIYDYLSSQKVDYFIANSKEVAERIRKFYKRESVVIQPPINTKNLKLVSKNRKKTDFYLFASRLFSYKHPELAIAACLKLKKKLVIAGDGALREQVKAAAEKSNIITYLGRVSDQKLWQLYRDCKAFIYPVELEDFGMMPLEAASTGTPTIAYFSGGVKETIIPNKTGVYFYKLDVDSLISAIKKFESKKFSSADCKKWANKFSKENFKKRIKDFVLKKI